MKRYSRQIILPEVGVLGQEKFAKSRILIIGAGGLAATVLPQLTGTGIGHLTIIDSDIIELSNLHRQTLFKETDCGKPKAHIAAERCRQLNSKITIVAKHELLTPANARQLILQADLILDCADSYAVSYTLSDICFELNKPLISASVLGLSGYVGGFCASAPSLRAVFPDAPDDNATCTTSGVLSPVVGIIGSFQAQMALGILLKTNPSPLGQIVQFDLHSYHSSGFRFDKAVEPEHSLRFAAKSDLSQSDMIIELRDAQEAPVPILPSAHRILPENVHDHLPPISQRLALCCGTGLRAWKIAEHIQQNWSGEIILVAAKAS